MPHMICYKLIPMTGGVVGHGLQETTNRLLVKWCDASVLLYQQVFDVAESVHRQRSAQAIEDIGDIKTELARDFAQVRRCRITRSSFVIGLGPFGYSKRFCNLVLRQSATLTFFLQSGAYLFGKVQNFSSLIFTNAP